MLMTSRSSFTGCTPSPNFMVADCSGELLGGCDIIMELQQAGELKESIDEMRDRT